MAEPRLSSPPEAVPGTPGIKEIRFDSGSGCMGENPSPSPRPGIRRVSLRAEIDTSPPFGSVMEAVTRFGGHGPWINPLYKFGDHNFNGEEEFDIKKVEEQTAELEKDLIVKELETLDVLEELTTTKRIVEELKRQLQKEALKCLNTLPHQQRQDLTNNSDTQDQQNLPISPYTKEININNNNNNNKNIPTSPCPTSSPDFILMELKRAKLNLGKTITDLGAIQSSVESLTKKMRKEKEFIEKTRLKLTSKLAGHEEARAGDEILVNNCMKKTAEMRWLAARKMSEAARAAEAVALAEITALTGPEELNAPPPPLLSEPDKMSFNFMVRSPLQCNPSGWSRKRLALADAMLRIDEAHASKIAIMRKLKEASDEVKLSRQAMEEALHRVDSASRKQMAVEDALTKWMVVQPERRVSNAHLFRQNDHRHIDYRNAAESPVVDEADCHKPVLKTTVSMRDVLSKKQAPSDHDYHYGGRSKERDRNSNNGHGEAHKVALSDMLQALRDDLNFPTKAEKEHHIAASDVSHHDCHGVVNHPQKPFLAQRKKFGFIQISLPLTRPSKKKMAQQSL